MELTLGLKVKDPISGFSGTVISRAVYLHGSPRVEVSSDLHDGKLTDEWFYEDQLQPNETIEEVPSSGAPQPTSPE